MLLNKVPAGKKLPEDFNVIIEIPAFSSPVKYEIDKESGALFCDRFVATGMQYPLNYGFINETLSLDGDPVDVLVLTPFPLVHGSVIRCRAVGVLKMEDESGIDAKILAVPVSKVTPIYDYIKDVEDFPASVKDQVQHFFENYKALEKGKWVKVQGWDNKAAAEEEILASAKRYNG